LLLLHTPPKTQYLAINAQHSSQMMLHALQITGLSWVMVTAQAWQNPKIAINNHHHMRDRQEPGIVLVHRSCYSSTLLAMSDGVDQENINAKFGDNDAYDGPPTNDNNEPVDFQSFHDIDFAAMDPPCGMDWEEYEAYLSSRETPEEDLVWDDSVPTLNQIFVVGRVGQAPETRYLPDNNVVVTLSIALPRYYNYWEREYLQVEYGQEETEWYSLECWGKLGEFVAKNVEKGTRVGVIGAIDQDYYPNKETGKVSTNCKILVQDLDILESKMEAESRKEGGQRGPSFYTSDDDDEDDDNGDFGPGSMQGGSAGGFFDPF
jgi:single-strand DNA-binding protein